MSKHVNFVKQIIKTWLVNMTLKLAKPVKLFLNLLRFNLKLSKFVKISKTWSNELKLVKPVKIIT